MDVVLVVLLILLFLVAVFLAAAETALVRVSRVRVAALAEEGSRRARRLEGMLADPTRVLNAILLAALLVQIGAATVTGVLADRWFGGVGITLASVVLTLLLFVYSEAIPKTYAVRHPARVAMAVVTPVAMMERLLRPLVAGLVAFADLQAPGRGVATAPTVTEAELIRLSSTAAAEGAITPVDAQLIARAFRFGDRTADEVMVPRVDIVSVPGAASASEALDTALAAGHRRLPVFEDDPEHISGIVHMRDLASVATTEEDRLVSSLVRPALFVPEGKRIATLLADMQSGGTHVAIIVDEHGGIAGMVTIEDIVEELLGAVADEGQAAPRPAVEVQPGRFVLDGRTPIDDASDVLGVDLPEGEWTTVAGLLMGSSGRVLQTGDTVTVGPLHFRVTAARRRRIISVEVERPDAKPAVS